MGGGTMDVDLTPMIQFKPSPSSIPSVPSTSSVNFPVLVNETVASLGQSYAASCGHRQSGTCTRVLESVVHGKDYDERNNGVSPYNVVLGTVPSQLEVESAIASLQNFMSEVSSSGMELNQFQQMLDCCGVRTLLSRGYGRARNAFSLLQTDSSIKALVISLASDKAVWDAVVNNEAVRKLQESCYPAEECRKESCREEESDIATSVLRWIMDITKAKVIELIDKFTLLMDEVFQPVEKEKPREETRHKVDEKVSSSLLLSIVILLIVVVARTRGG